MKLRHLVNATAEQPPGILIAKFGRAGLIKRRKGGWLLEGGSRSDRIEAREWISLFMHEVVVRER